jgi:hypothetical protein
MITLNLCPTAVPIGVTMGWGMQPTRLWRRSDGSTFIRYADKRLSPEAYGSDGWPIGLSICD